MEYQRRVWDLEKQSGIVKCLIAMCGKDKQMLSTIAHKTELSTTVLHRAIQRLIDLELVDQDRSDKLRRYLVLTDKGQKIAEKLKEIDKIMIG